jgi:hypothetical protein
MFQKIILDLFVYINVTMMLKSYRVLYDPKREEKLSWASQPQSLELLAPQDVYRVLKERCASGLILHHSCFAVDQSKHSQALPA